MRTTFLILLLLAAATLLPAQPVIDAQGVQNAASYFPADLPGRGLAPGSMFIVRGSGLGPEELVSAWAPYPLQLPAGSGGTKVRVRSLASAMEALASVVYTSDAQVAAILPASFPAGQAELTVAYGGADSDAVAFEVLDSAPGLFTVAQNGVGPAVVQNYVSSAEQPVNGLMRPALPGQYIILWGTGLGSATTKDVKIQLGGGLLQPDYAGPAPGYPGLDQINVRLPDDLNPEGCYTRLTLQTTKGREARPVFFATAGEPGPCQHPMGLSNEQMERLDAGGTLSVASLTVQSWGAFDRAVESERFVADMRRLRAWEVAVMANIFQYTRLGSWWPPGGAPFCLSSDGTITSLPDGDGSIIREPLPGFGRTPFILSPDPLLLDAGETMQLAGPGGRHLVLRKADDWERTGYYQPANEDASVPQGWFDGGEWLLTAPGGEDLGGFAAPFALPAPIQAELPGTVDRSQGVEVTWKPAAIASETVILTLSAFGTPEPHPMNPDLIATPVKRFECHVPAKTGAFTILPTMLAEFPASEDAAIALKAGSASDYVVRFDLPGVDYSVFQQSTAVSRKTAVR